VGLTIYYYLSKEADGLESAAETIEALRQTALDLPFEEVGEVRCFEGNECDPERWRNTEWLWPVIQGLRYINLGGRGGRPVMSVGVVPLEMAVFSAWPGEGSEPMILGLARYPRSVKLSPKTRSELFRRTGKEYPSRISTGALKDGWQWKAFCKTQYASNVSVGHFIRCHTAVCALLRRARDLGFVVRVRDEGEFWGKWDPAALAREVGRWNAFVASLARAIEEAGGARGLTVGSPITGNPAYYEAAGLDPITARLLADLAKEL
jgi:hypothetical protein